MAKSDALTTRLAVRRTLQTGVGEPISTRQTGQKVTAVVPAATPDAPPLVADQILQQNQGVLQYRVNQRTSDHRTHIVSHQVRPPVVRHALARLAPVPIGRVVRQHEYN